MSSNFNKPLEDYQEDDQCPHCKIGFLEYMTPNDCLGCQYPPCDDCPVEILTCDMCSGVIPGSDER